MQYVHQYADASFDRLAPRLSKEPITLLKWSKCVLGAVAAGCLTVGGYEAVDIVANLKPREVYVVNPAVKELSQFQVLCDLEKCQASNPIRLPRARQFKKVGGRVRGAIRTNAYHLQRFCALSYISDCKVLK